MSHRMPADVNGMNTLLADLSQLKNILAAERETLAEGSADSLGEALETISRDKSELLQRLDSLFRGTGLPEAGGDNADADFAQLHALLNECDHLNRVNGSMIDVSQRRTQHILDILTDHPNSGRLYGADGATVSDHRTRLSQTV